MAEAAARLLGPDGRPLPQARADLVRASVRLLSGLEPHERRLVFETFCPRCRLLRGWAGTACACRECDE